MSRGTPLETLIELSRKSRDSAGKTLAEERRQGQHSERQLDTLRQYREDYASRMQSALQGGVDAATLSNFRAFLHSLDAAIARARQALEQQEKRVANSQEHWRREQRRLSSYGTLAERRAQGERIAEQRRESRQHDELATAGARERLQRHQLLD